MCGWLYLLFRQAPVSQIGVLDDYQYLYSKQYSKALEYEYRVKTATLGTLKRYSILSLTLYLEWYNIYFIVDSGGPIS
jgi:hypothetical protein